MNNDFGIHELDELLKEKINIEQIVFPTVNQQIINRAGIEYIFENGEKFEGRMENNMMRSGIYTWPNRQQYKGDFSENNNLRKGEIIFFHSNNKLTGIYNENREAFERCIYETDSYVYEGNVRKLISYKNTYAYDINDKKLIFAKPIKNGKFYELCGITLEKGYAYYNAYKTEEKTIKSGYEKIEGNWGYTVYETFFGSKSEKFKCNIKKLKDFKDIDKDTLKKKYYKIFR